MPPRFALLACREALRRLEGDERGAGAALAVLLPIYLLHALADIDWDFVAASAPVLFAVGVLLAAGRPAAEPRSRPVLAVVACVAGLGVLYSMTAPWLAQRRVEAAYEAIAENDVAGAVSAARQARDLNPLSVEPLWAWALADARSSGSVPHAAPIHGRDGAPARELRHVVRARRVRARHRPLPRRVRPPRPRVRPRPVRPGGGARRPARPGPREGGGPLARAEDDRDVGAHEVLHA